jgi:hypothetical protein
MYNCIIYYCKGIFKNIYIYFFFLRNYIFGLLNKDFDVHCACDGRDALRTIRKANKLPDLVLSGKDYS